MEIMTNLQRLRDDAEGCSRLRAERGDRDSADAWERIGIELDELQRRIAHDARIIEERRGLFP